MRATLALVALPVLLSPAIALADASVDYEVRFPDLARHEARVTLEVRGLDPGIAELRMSRSSPGRYALHEFAKNVYGETAADLDGRPLEIERPDPHGWIVHHGGALRFHYTLFADRADGTYSGIDHQHAHPNLPASFVWVRGLEDSPIRIRFERPDPSWRVSTQLFPTDDPEIFTAPDLQYFLDSPTEISDHAVYSWQSGSQSYRVALHHRGSDEEARAFVAACQAIVEETAAVFGEVPRFDVGNYTFLADYLPTVHGDGMEHRNSTVLTSTLSIAEEPVRLLGTVAHEFVHAWNIERLRPRSLEPFDFERANASGELWFGEGFTSYYGVLILERAGLIGLESFAGRLGGMLDRTINAPGRRLRSPVEMSLRAPFVDAARWVDPVNDANTYLSYYTYGAALGLGLDLELRTRFARTLDDYMRALWSAFGEREIPYTLDDLERVLGDVSGDPAWASAFFERSIHGSELPDHALLLRAGGLILRPARPTDGWLGAAMDFAEGDATLETVIHRGPLDRAGLGRGDRLLELDGKELRSAGQLTRLMAGRAGQTLVATVRHRGETEAREIEITLSADPELEVVTFESAGLEVPPAVAAFRETWLGPGNAQGRDLKRYCPRDARAWPFEYSHCPLDGRSLVLSPPSTPP